METALEHVLISSYKEGMISFVEEHPEDFEELINLAIADKQPFSWRAAWLLWSCMEENDARIRKYVDTMIGAMTKKKDGHQRELLKILYVMDLDEDQEGQIFDTCVSVWEKINKTPSVRFTAFKFITKMAKKYPELSNEISFLTENQYLESLSPGVKRSIAKMINEFAFK